VPNVAETAYPRLKSHFTAKELQEIYTPTKEDLKFALLHTRTADTRLNFLILFKTFQRLGYFIPLQSVPQPLIKHICEQMKLSVAPRTIAKYDASRARWRHTIAIREYLNIKPYGVEARRAIVSSIAQAAITKHDLADLINVAIEELIHHRYELPVFNTLATAAKRIRHTIHRQFYQQLFTSLSQKDKVALNSLFEPHHLNGRTPWHDLKQDPGRPILKNLTALVGRLRWLDEIGVGGDILTRFPDVKVKQFAAEAMTLDAARMKELELSKFYTLAAAAVRTQAASTLDDIAEMFIKRMLKIHHKGEEALKQYRLEHLTRTDRLIATLRDVVVAYQTEGEIPQRFAQIDGVIGDRSHELLSECEAHIAYSGNNYYPFLWQFTKSHRTTLFGILKWVKLKSTSQDTSLEEAIQFLLLNQHTRKDWLEIITSENQGTPAEKTVHLLNLDWISPKWWFLVTDQRTRKTYPSRLHRRHFEVCVFSQILWELKSGDLYIEGSDAYADYRQQQISWDEYHRTVGDYGKLVGLPVEGKAFVAHLKNWLEEVTTRIDRSFPKNQSVRWENDKLTIKKTKKTVDLKTLTLIESLIKERLKPVNLLDILTDTQLWLNWTRFFHPVSGQEARIESPIARYLAATFCYGCYLGTFQTARSLNDFDPRQVAYVNQRHITEENLDRAIALIINAYNQFNLPKFWGTGKRVSADGTKWDIYEQNLLAEYHIRYGGYGGIGYYHVSDTYIALFSHFIPCGVWEAVFILDGLLKNQSDIQPDIIHADTQGQNEPVFGLAYLLGISLMPRIRNWHSLKFYRPRSNSRYEHIDELFSDVVNLELIETHLPDMLRAVLSIKAGKFTASAILRQLGTYSQKNKLYQAFSELGRVVRTVFLLEYLGSEELRGIIQGAVNKSEAFNGLAKWVGFGHSGVIASNSRDEQCKIIKYNHLVSNCLIFYNVFEMSRILQELMGEGYEIDQEVIGALSPYLTGHINRFGRYSLDLNRQPPVLDYELLSESIPLAVSASEKTDR
jgi:TnpA family transposase